LITTVLVILAVGTTFYTIVEDWSVVQALYFTVITLTTIGYGDLYPTTEFSRIFTIFFVLAGVSTLLGFLNFILGRTVQEQVARKEAKAQKSAQGDLAEIAGEGVAPESEEDLE
jgi:hypothetical protein